MSSFSLKEPLMDTPNDFEFPFTPYSIQKKLMESLFRAIEDGKLGIFESPTGTGKSMSVICGVFKWLKLKQNHRFSFLSQKLSELESVLEENSNNSEDWLQLEVQNIKIKEQIREIKKELIFIKSKEEMFSKNSQELLSKKLYYASGRDETTDYFDHEEEKEEDFSFKVYFCSRTHSQLSQFVKEIKKTTYKNDVRLVSLGSRSNTCINESVKSLKENGLINEKCLELHSKKEESELEDEAIVNNKVTKKCPYYGGEKIRKLSRYILDNVRDIEEVVEEGNRKKSCPYYSSRLAASDAEVVVLPYNTLLDKSARIASGLKLERSVVIVDEAHNLLDTMCKMQTKELRKNTLEILKSHISGYLRKYRSRMSPKNLLFIKQISMIVSQFLKVISSKDPTPISIIDFISETNLIGIDLRSLITYISKNKLGFKLTGVLKNNNEITAMKNFLTSVVENSSKDDSKSSESYEESPSRAMMALVSFLECLITDTDEGNILINKEFLKFVLLNPINHFKDLVRDCRSILLIGGTMEPVEEFENRLFKMCGASQERISKFSCGHVIPKENLLPIILHSGPSGTVLDFSYGNRSSAESLKEIFALIRNLKTIIPGGIVVFFPSYEYESVVYNSFGSKIKNFPIFREPKKANETEEVLSRYSKAANSSTGAILFSVVGGKLSEGINFSDDLGRCVLMIGLPFGNPNDTETRLKINFLHQLGGDATDKNHLEISCMKAVNQSIGRAVRHANDYSIIVLADCRYSRSSIKSLLPEWIRNSTEEHKRYSTIVSKVVNFFKSKR